jgi:hypothetical protein
VSVELYGAGGGGGGALINGFGASGGGSGAYTRTVLVVTEGSALIVNVGVSGSPGLTGVTNTSQGTAGGDTTITDQSSNVLALAGGGGGGFLPAGLRVGDLFCGGSGGRPDGHASISHAGNTTCGGAVAAAVGLAGGPGFAPLGFLPGQIGTGGDGSGSDPSSSNRSGTPGAPGYALITW